MRRITLPIVASILGAGLLGLLIYGVTHQAASRTLDDAVAKGQRPAAPQSTYRLPILSGHGLSSLATYRGQVVLLNFWASWCEPCEEEAPLLQSAQGQLRLHNATVLGVTYGDNTSDAGGFVKRFHLSYPNLRDASGDFARSYGTDQLPESFLIDRSGHIVAISRGELAKEQGKAFIKRAVTLAQSS